MKQNESLSIMKILNLNLPKYQALNYILKQINYKSQNIYFILIKKYIEFYRRKKKFDRKHIFIFDNRIHLN